MKKIIFILLGLFLINACSIQELTTTQISSSAERFLSEVEKENAQEGFDVSTKIIDIQKKNNFWEVDYYINISDGLKHVLLERTLKLNNKGMVLDDISKTKTTS